MNFGTVIICYPILELFIIKYSRHMSGTRPGFPTSSHSRELFLRFSSSDYAALWRSSWRRSGSSREPLQPADMPWKGNVSAMLSKNYMYMADFIGPATLEKKWMVRAPKNDQHSNIAVLWLNGHIKPLNQILCSRLSDFSEDPARFQWLAQRVSMTWHRWGIKYNM